MIHTVGVIRGDGTGPEVIGEGLKVLDAVRGEAAFDLVEFDLGADRYLRTGDTLPHAELEQLRGLDAIFLGAVGDPRVKPGVLERDLLLKARFGLDQYVNLRPVVRYPGVETLVPAHAEDDVNMVVVRENSEGLYSGAGGFHRRGTEHEVAVQESINTRHGVERIVRYAFELAMQPQRRRKVTLVHKTNVLTFAGDLYQRVVDEVSAAFPDVETDYVHVDAACIYFLDSPSRFDVIVTDNMFGDIITDLGAMIQGGMGIAAGGNINPDGVSMFEPIGGTAPSETGKGTINPLAAIGALEMLLRQIGETEAADRVDMGIRAATRQMKSMRAGEMGFTTAEVGDLVVEGTCVNVELYDTTLRDGAQQADLSYTVEDRLRILHKLDQVGFPFVEGGWPGANPRDTEFFQLATKETLKTSSLTAFGMTRRAGERADGSQALRDLLDAGTEVVCLVGKAWDLHVTEALRTDLDEGVAMVGESVEFLRGPGAARVLRRRALLRRLPIRRRVRDGGARCG